MLTQDQRDNFRLALASFNKCGRPVSLDDIDDMCDDADIVVTAETIADFKSARGAGYEVEHLKMPVEDVVRDIGELLIWKNIQTRKGARRGDLYLMDLGNARAVYFTGE